MKNKSLLTISAVLLLIMSCSKEAVKIPKEVNVNFLDLDVSTIHTESQKVILESDNPGQYIYDHSAQYGRRSASKPLPINFSWEEENDLNQKATNYKLLISEYEDLSYPLTYVTKENSINVYNLKINTNYYYQVQSNHHGKYFSSETKSFDIEDVAPRNIYVDGVENVRDLGGWYIGESKVYKQGLIYRTAQFNYGQVGNNTFKSAPTEAGKKALLNELKIKTEIDLRRTEAFDGYDEVVGITSSPLGDTVNYVSAPMYYGNTNIFANEDNHQSIKLFFDTLADINNYPIAFHCVRGTDRTGALAYVLGALVGMSKEDLMLDYLFSDLANIGNPVFESTITADDFFVKGIDDSEGSTLSEKTIKYLHSTVGVSVTTLETIIDILTE